MPFRNVARIGSCAVVIVLEGRDLRFRIGRYQAIFRIERLSNIVVDAQGSIEEPLLPGPGLVPMKNAQAFQRGLRQKRAATCQSALPDHDPAG